MPKQANVQAIEALRLFRDAMREYTFAVQDVAAQLLLETHRTVDWVESDRQTYWPAMVRRHSDELAEATAILERKQLVIRHDERPACSEEKEAVYQAKQQLQHAENRVRAVRHWTVVVQRQADAYRASVAKLVHMVDVDLPRGTGALDRMIVALERYAERDVLPRGSLESAPPSAHSGTGGHTAPEAVANRGPAAPNGERT